MTFDSAISSEVSLSKILDAFILDDETPSIIITFLKQHDDAFADILQYSLYCNRLFQLDFFLKCSEDEQQYIITKLKDINIYDAAILTWQVLKSNSRKAQHVKYKLRKELKWIQDHSQRHPYSNGHEHYIKALDDICFKFAKDNTISNIPCIINNSELTNYFKYLSYSLFQDRLLQYDFFANLSVIAKYLFIKTTFDNCEISIIKRFAMQLLDSNEDLEVKKLVFDKLYARIVPTDLLDKKTLDIVLNCACFSELMLKMTIFNIDASQYIVLYLLLFKSKWIKEWIEYDRKKLNSYLNISDFAIKFLNLN